MEKETKPNLIEAEKAMVEDKSLPDDGELQDEELDEVSGGTKANQSGSIVSNLTKIWAELQMQAARNLK